MKICYPCFIKLPSKSAHAINMMEMCEAFSRQGIETVLVTPFMKVCQEEVLKMYGIRNPFLIKRTNWRLPGRGKFFFSLPLMLYVKKNISPNIIYTRNLSLAFWSIALKIPTFLEVHKPFMGIIEKKRLGHIVKSKYFLNLIVISGYLKKYYSKFSDKILLCPDGVDLKKFSNNTIVCEPPVVGYTGNLYRGRGIEIIIELARAFKNINFHIWGGDDGSVSMWRSETQNIFNLTFHGFIPHCDIYKALQRCKVLLSPYQREVYLLDGKTNTAEWMSPMKLFEYMGSGRPIISSDIPSIKEILSHNRNALLVSPDNIDEWKRALEFILSHEAYAFQIAEQAKRDAAEHYSWEKRAGRVLGSLVSYSSKEEWL